MNPPYGSGESVNPDYGSVGGGGYEEIPLMGQPRQQCMYQAAPPQLPPLRQQAPAAAASPPSPSERSFSTRLRTLASVASSERYEVSDNVLQAVGQAYDNGGYMAPANSSVRLDSGDFTSASDSEVVDVEMSDVEYSVSDDDDVFLASLPVFNGHRLVYRWLNEE